MDLKELIKNGVLNELAALFRSHERADLLLDLIDFPIPERPSFPDNGQTLGYWREVCNLIQSGILSTGTDLQPLVNEAATFFPQNRVFSQYCTSSPPLADPSERSDNELFTVWIRGRDDADNVLRSAQSIARSQNILSDNINLRFAGNGNILLGINHSNSTAAANFLQELQTVLQSSQNPVNINLSTDDPQPYLLSHIFVEGPDENRFALENIWSDTRVREIPQAMVNEYYPQMLQDSRGGRRRLVVDRANEDGSTERLNGDHTLHEAHIQEGDTLNVSPEATAGNVHPQLRQEALVRVKNQISDYARTHPNFQAVAKDLCIPPRSYTLSFVAPSFAPPTAAGEPPPPQDSHEVSLHLPDDFPMIAPQVVWQTPIFHPNIDPTSGLVCLGDLGDRYQPGLDFGLLCQLLIDIASYQNYAVEEGYNLEAQEWACSPEGQQAIEARGGQCITRRLIQQEETPRQLNIKRLTYE